MVGWHNAEIFAPLPGMRGYYYVLCPAWWSKHEGSSVSSMPMPAVAYCSNILMKCKRSEGLIWYISVAEFAVIALRRFLGAGRESTDALSCADNRMGLNECFLLVRFPVQTQIRIENIGFL